VLAKGEAVKLDVAPGDTIVYNKYAMAEVEVPEGEVVFVAEKSVLGKLE
jgi:chaperonin GroES